MLHATIRNFWVSLSRNQKKKKNANVSLGMRSGEKVLDIVAEKNVTFCLFMNSNMVKSEKYDHLHFVYCFNVALEIICS